MTVMPTPRAAESAQPFTFKTRTTASPARVIRVTGEAEPNILARIVQPLVKLDLMPRFFQVLSEDGSERVAECGRESGRAVAKHAADRDRRWLGRVDLTESLDSSFCVRQRQMPHQAADSAARSARLRTCGSRWRLRRRIAPGVISTSSSSLM